MYACLCSSGTVHTPRSMPMMLSFVALYFEELTQGKAALIWKERCWVLLSNVVIFVIFIQLISSIWGILVKIPIVSKGNREFIKGTGSLQMWPLFKYVHLESLYSSSRKNQSVQRKPWILTPKNKDHSLPIKLTMTKDKEYLLLRVWEHGFVGV